MSMPSTLPPDETLCEDPGDETARRFRFQWTWAAISCCAMLDDESDVVDIFCEHHEDVLIKHRDGTFSGHQVKTRDSAQAWKAADTQIKSALARFVQLDVKYPNYFRDFKVLTNHPFHTGENAQSLEYVLCQIFRASTPTELRSPVACWLHSIQEEAHESETSTFHALKKVTIDDKLPKLQDSFIRLVDILEKGQADRRHYSHAAFRRAAQALVDECARASALDDQQELPTYITAMNGPEAAVQSSIAGKRMTVDRVRSVLSTGFNSAATLIRDPERPVEIHMPEAAAHFLGRKEELLCLDRAWDRCAKVLVINARGGQGKTALVMRWLLTREESKLRLATRIFAWSFDSQGRSLDEFIVRALAFFGDSSPTEGALNCRAARLARLVGKDRNLLILDGIQSLQNPPIGGELSGRLDKTLTELLSNLMIANSGLCLVTSRTSVTELAGGNQPVKLPGLSDTEGAELLSMLGVRGSELERRKVAEHFKGFPLALRLVGNYVARIRNGNVSYSYEVPFMEQDTEGERECVKRMMQWYDAWLCREALPSDDSAGNRSGGGSHAGRQMLAVLRLVGLFDGPIELDCIKLLSATPGISKLTGPLTKLRREQWTRTLSRLCDLELLSSSSANYSILDCHSLIRSYYAHVLDNEFPDSTREAHRRLSEHLKETADKYPNDLDSMKPLFQAIVHGCRAASLAGKTGHWEAGNWREFIGSVFDIKRERIERIVPNAPSPPFFQIRQIGAFGLDLDSMREFVPCFDYWRVDADEAEELWKQPCILGYMAYDCRCLGRLGEAAELYELCFTGHVEPIKSGAASAHPELTHNAAWYSRWAARNGGYLVEVQTARGKLLGAAKTAFQVCDLAQASLNAFLPIWAEAKLAYVLSLCGAGEHALPLYAKAEQAAQMLPDKNGQVLYAGIGYGYFDALVRHREIFQKATDEMGVPLLLQRAESMLRLTKENHSDGMGPVDYALSYLAVGRACSLWKVRHRKCVESKDSITWLSDGVECLRGKVRDEMYLPHALLVRASQYRVIKEWRKAEDDLCECAQLLARGEMRICEIDLNYEWARFHRDCGKLTDAQEKLDHAKRLNCEIRESADESEVCQRFFGGRSGIDYVCPRVAL
jgi:hypothetical protein